MGSEKNGWYYPDGLDPKDHLYYTIPYGDSEVTDLGWHGHVDLLRQRGFGGIDTEVVDSGTDDQGILYAVVKVTVTVDGGQYSSLAGADETSNQVRDPEHVWSVAESRAIKRATKKALGIHPADGGTAEYDEPEQTNVSREPDVPDGVEFDADHALADNAGADGVGEGEGW